MNYKEEEVEFTGWASGGNALGKLKDGRVVFAGKVLPGERARVRYADREARFISAEVTRLLTKSPMRIEPRCPLFGSCAECRLQILEYPDQLHAKREVLLDHLTRMAGVENAAELLPKMLPAPSEWNWSRDLRLWLDSEGNFCLPDERGGGLKLEAYCPIAAECLNDSLASFTFEPDSGSKELEFRAGDDDDIQLILRGESEKPEDEMENNTDISVVYAGPSGSYVMSGVSTLCQTAAGVRVCASDSSPFLRNPAALDVICKAMEPILGDMSGVTVLDIHCGTGFWARWLGARCKALNGVMEDEYLVEDFAYNLDDLDNASLYIGGIQEILGGLPVPEREWVWIEGGKSGLTEPELRALCVRSPEKIFYHSEDPAILARDLRRLLDLNRRLETVVSYDPAPQTPEIAAVAVLN